MFRDEPRRSHPCLSGEEGVCAVIEAYGSCLSRANVVAAVTMLSNHGEELFPFFFETPDCHFQRKPSTRSFHLLRVHRHVARRRVTPPRAWRSKEEERRTEKIRKGSTDGVFYKYVIFILGSHGESTFAARHSAGAPRVHRYALPEAPSERLSRRRRQILGTSIHPLNPVIFILSFKKQFINRGWFVHRWSGVRYP